jgi:hypothetical protein
MGIPNGRSDKRITKQGVVKLPGRFSFADPTQ